MMKHEVLITLIGNMFIDAYVAGDRKDLESFRTAKADREQLYDEVKELYEALDVCSETMDDLNREIAQLEKELKEAREELKEISTVIKSDCDNATVEWLSKYTNVFDHLPDDAGKFSEQDLPFPDLEEMAPAEEVDGADE